MSYKILLQEGIDKARPILAERGAVPSLKSYEAVVGRADLIDDTVLKDVAGTIRKIQTAVEKEKLQSEELDRRCFHIVHEVMQDFPDVAGDMAFWTRFAIVELAPIIYKRFPPKRTKKNPNGKMNLDNFGIGARGECWPYKLWVRGELSFDKTNAKDPYALGRLGSVDLWTSHVHRQNLMSIRHMFRSVMTFQYPKHLKGKPLLIEGEEPEGKFGLRTLMKRLRENWASVEFSYLSEIEAVALVKIHGKGLHATDGKSVL